MLTTLTAAAVLPCQLAQGRTRAKFVVCVCNVGDSLAYVFSERHGVREITKGQSDGEGRGAGWGNECGEEVKAEW